MAELGAVQVPTGSESVAIANARMARARASFTRARVVLPPLGVLVLIIALWYAGAAMFDAQGRSFVLPYPHLVFEHWFLDPARRLEIFAYTLNTIQVMLIGLAIAIVIGVVWAVLMSQAKWLERSLYPYAVILQCIPILALVPLIGISIGYNTPARIVVTVMISLFPMVSNTLFGLQSAERGQRELFQLQGASRLTRLIKLQFPSALPLIFVGLRNAAGLSVIGAIVGDQFFKRGDPGIGVLIYNYASRLQSADLYAAILTASLLGVVVFLLFGLLGRLAIGRWYDFG
ncbi:ABC transporter permease [Galbitalea sp. SE-J8]|uniref:ABC transporter permease n=1 Tax=Galbitalea sp. SE-J8 TaxID=3054952 RepID=UPI00259D1DB5|nr:ABC transporter permease [Galbitalea sp. SE-J8]MDM4762124.1 ABC transporter permease [Galbitalea sp. SE-J8]